MGKEGCGIGGTDGVRSPFVFVSYSRQDAKWRDWFVGMLAPLVRRRRLEVWTDQREVVGEEWRPQLEDAISRSSMALLLVSRPFLASPFIMGSELPALIEHEVRLVPVLVGDCLWDQEPLLERLQWAHDPTLDPPPTQKQKREAWIVPGLPRSCSSSSRHEDEVVEAAQQRLGRRGVAAVRPLQLARGSDSGALHNVPPLPQTYIAREELSDLRRTLLAGEDGVVGVTGRLVGFQGAGGIGKTVLASALARDDEVRRHFPDGVFWVTIGESGDLVAAQIELLAAAGGRASGAAYDGRRALRCCARRWRTAAACWWSMTCGRSALREAFRAAGPRGRVLYTTRDRCRARGRSARGPAGRRALDRRRPPAALGADGGARRLPPEADQVLAATGRVALAVALVGAAIGRRGRSLAAGPR